MCSLQNDYKSISGFMCRERGKYVEFGARSRQTPRVTKDPQMM
jgi:hypothetical protein